MCRECELPMHAPWPCFARPYLDVLIVALDVRQPSPVVAAWLEVGRSQHTHRSCSALLTLAEMRPAGLDRGQALADCQPLCPCSGGDRAGPAASHHDAGGLCYPGHAAAAGGAAHTASLQPGSACCCPICGSQGSAMCRCYRPPTPKQCACFLAGSTPNLRPKAEQILPTAVESSWFEVKLLKSQRC